MEHEIYLGLMDHDARLSNIEEVLIKAKLMKAPEEPETTEEPKEETKPAKKKPKF